MTLALLASALWTADLLSGLALPSGSEANPIGAVLLASPLLAIAGKSAVLSLAVNAAQYHPRVLAVCASAGVVGLASNLRAIL